MREYDATDGTTIGVFASGGGLAAPSGLAFGPGGDLYVSSTVTNDVKRFDGATGMFEGVFASGGGLSDGRGIAFGLDGNLYVASSNSHEIIRYNGIDGSILGAFVPAASGGLGGPLGIAFVPEPPTLRLCALGALLVLVCRRCRANHLRRAIAIGAMAQRPSA